MSQRETSSRSLILPRSLVLLRHGQSTTNAAGTFTGWVDVDLSDVGREEARSAARLLRSAGLQPDVIHTSMLRRTIHTAQLVADELDRAWLPVRRSWRLNERQYGALTGRNKTQVRIEAGAPQYQRWRRSFDTAPPPMAAADLDKFRHDPRYAGVPADAFPVAESLADIMNRAVPYWFDALIPDLVNGTVLVVAHGNSIRALVAHLDKVPPQETAALNIPTGMPLCYEFDDCWVPRHPGGRYLDPEAARAAAQAIAMEGQ